MAYRFLSKVLERHGSGNFIPRSELSKRTQANLSELERYGFNFEDLAQRILVSQRRGFVSPPHLAKRFEDIQPRYADASSFVVRGTYDNEDVIYERRETSHMAAGQTFLWIGGRQYYLTSILEKLHAGKNPLSAPRAHKRYGV